MASNSQDETDRHSHDDLKETIDKLKRPDRFGVAGSWLNTAGGVAAGASAAGGVASAVGATTILGSSTLGSVFGGVLVASTPIGWIAGCAIAGGAAAYGMSKLIKSGGKSDRVREEIVSRLSARLSKMGNKGTKLAAQSELHNQLEEAILNGHLEQAQAQRIAVLVERGKLDREIALARIRALSSEVQVPAK